MRNLHRSDQIEAHRIEDLERAGAAIAIDDVAHHPAIAFSRIAARNEDELVGDATFAEIDAAPASPVARSR